MVVHAATGRAQGRVARGATLIPQGTGPIALRGGRHGAATAPPARGPGTSCANGVGSAMASPPRVQSCCFCESAWWKADRLTNQGLLCIYTVQHPEVPAVVDLLSTPAKGDQPHQAAQSNGPR